jgi:ABC-type Zn uptake system ZnuABC Zn-binding protein ZnuA
VVEFHKVWAYVAADFGFELVGTIEEKPGIAPGPRHVKDTIQKVKASGVKLILVDNFYDAALPRRIAKETGAKVVVLANSVRGEKRIKDYFALIDHVLTSATAALEASATR